MNLIGLKGSLQLERGLIESGRAKPFFNSDWTSFLIWAKKYRVNLDVYLTTKEFHEERYKKLGRYKDFSDKKFNDYKILARARYNRLLERFEKQIIITKNPINKLDSLLENGEKVVLLIADYYSGREPILPHLIVAYKKEKGKYFFMDSAHDLIKLTKQQIEKGIEINKKMGTYPYLVAYKKQ